MRILSVMSLFSASSVKKRRQWLVKVPMTKRAMTKISWDATCFSWNESNGMEWNGMEEPDVKPKFFQIFVYCVRQNHPYVLA